MIERPYRSRWKSKSAWHIGIFDDLAQALDFEEKAVQQLASTIDELSRKQPEPVLTCLGFFPNVNRIVGGPDMRTVIPAKKRHAGHIRR